MTPGTILLLLLLSWITVAYYAGAFVFKYTGKRWTQVITVLLVLWLPLWDVIPGLYLYQRAIREVAGVKIQRTVQADGYLNHSLRSSENAWTSLRGNRYRYIETEVTISDPRPGQSLIPVPGYYEFRVFLESKADCELRPLAPNQKRIHHENRHGFENICVISTRRDEPISRYEYVSGRKRLSGFGAFQPIGAGFTAVIDRETNEVIAETYSISFVSWLGRLIGVPRWKSHTANPYLPHLVIESVS